MEFALTGRCIHRVKIVGEVVSGRSTVCSIRIESDLSKAVRSARGHRPQPCFQPSEFHRGSRFSKRLTYNVLRSTLGV